jgi:hypothetical protein
MAYRFVHFILLCLRGAKSRPGLLNGCTKESLDRFRAEVAKGPEVFKRCYARSCEQIFERLKDCLEHRLRCSQDAY